uniref:Uncharacterized protein n=1 Tax=Triticum urartu TaxID=4572 RepID=A0A8R7Q7Y4_TRIUA
MPTMWSRSPLRGPGLPSGTSRPRSTSLSSSSTACPEVSLSSVMTHLNVRIFMNHTTDEVSVLLSDSPHG